jgi:hypothetical protein
MTCGHAFSFTAKMCARARHFASWRVLVKTDPPRRDLTINSQPVVLLAETMDNKTMDPILPIETMDFNAMDLIQILLFA